MNMNVMQRAPMLGQVRIMGQINSGFSWNSAPGGYNPYMPVAQAPINNTFGGRPAYAPPAPASAVEACFTCTKFGKAAQKSIPSSLAAQLMDQGWKCDEVACTDLSTSVSPAGGYSQYGNFMTDPGQVAPSSFSGDFMPSGGYTSYSGGMMEGRRIPLAGGLGRRALS